MLTNTITHLFPDAAFPLLVMIADAIILGQEHPSVLPVFEQKYDEGSSNPAIRLIEDYAKTDGSYSRTVEEDKQRYLEWRHMTPELIQEFKGMTTYEIQRSLGVPCP